MTVYIPAPARTPLWQRISLGDALCAVTIWTILFAGCWL